MKINKCEHCGLDIDYHSKSLCKLTKENMLKDTLVFEGEYNNKKMFEIHEVDDTGTKSGPFPVVKFGIKKAKAILKHIDELKKFVEENDK